MKRSAAASAPGRTAPAASCGSISGTRTGSVVSAPSGRSPEGTVSPDGKPDVVAVASSTTVVDDVPVSSDPEHAVNAIVATRAGTTNIIGRRIVRV